MYVGTQAFESGKNVEKDMTQAGRRAKNHTVQELGMAINFSITPSFI